MKKIKVLLLLLILQISITANAVPQVYGANNPMYEMFLIMMDMFGMIDYNNNRGFGSNGLSPYGYGAITPGFSQFNPMTNPVTAYGMLPQANQLNPQVFSNYLNTVQYKSPLEGVWLAGNGDVLVFLGEKFFYNTTGKKHLTGNARIVENKIIADIDDSEDIIKFFYEIKGQYLAIKVKKSNILYFKKQI